MRPVGADVHTERLPINDDHSINRLHTFSLRITVRRGRISETWSRDGEDLTQDLAQTVALSDSSTVSMFSDYPGLKRVPDFVGLDFDATQRLERDSGWSVRDPDPDAPPISNYWWSNKQLVVATQIPSAGSLLRRDERIGITLTEPPQLGTAPVVPSTPPNLEGHAPAD